MNKKYLIAFLVVIVAAGAFFYYRDQKGSTEAQKKRAKAFVELTDIARKVPKTGLTQMAAALKRYHQKFKAYPARLEELYPDYIPYRPFIDDIEWYYEPRGENFFLSKTVTRKQEQIVASIDKNMTPEIGAGLTVAAASPKKEKPPETTEEEGPVLALKPIETIQPIEPIAMEAAEPEEMIEQPEVVSMVEGEIGHGIPSDISRKLLVWKDKNGVLGFGNVIYPRTRNLTIYKDGNWLHIQKPTAPATPAESASPPARPEESAEKVAPEYSKKFLVWKDKKGNIGYGNVQYPSMDEIAYICVNGNWQKVVN